MNLTAVVERISDDRFRAIISQPFVIESEGRTADEAVHHLRELAVERLAAAQVIQIDVPERQGSHPWARWAGVWKDNPDYDDYVASIAEYRRNANGAEPRG